MALTTERITLPRGPGSLRQLVQSATHVVSVNASGASYLVDVSGKKPVVHELPMLIIRGEGSKPDQGLSVEAAAFSPDGSKLALLRAGVAIELLDVATREQVHRIALKLDAPRGVQWHPDGTCLYVIGDPQTYVYSPGGKVLNRIGTRGGFELSPDGAHYLIKMSDGQWVTRPVETAKFKEFVKLEAREATFIDHKTLLLSRWAKGNQEALFTASVTSGKVKKLALMPGTTSHAAFGGRAVAVDATGDKVAAVVIDLETGKSQRKELQGSPSGTAVCLDGTRAFVQVNWSKTIHVLRF